jgi:hypothetical protein
MALDPGLAAERCGDNGDAKMRLASGPVTGVSYVLMGFVSYFEAFRRKSLGQFICDKILGRHAACLRQGMAMGQSGWRQFESEIPVCQDLNVLLEISHNHRS